MVTARLADLIARAEARLAGVDPFSDPALYRARPQRPPSLRERILAARKADHWGEAWPVRTQWKQPIPVWTDARVRIRSGGRCESCGESHPAGARGLTLHHLRYHFINEHGPRQIFGRELPGDLIAVCADCHWSRHRPLGRFVYEPDFWVDPDEWRACGARLHLSAYIRDGVVKPPRRARARIEESLRAAGEFIDDLQTSIDIVHRSLSWLPDSAGEAAFWGLRYEFNNPSEGEQ